jgi:uncharacterized protein YigE (DUF2233 family)
MRPFHGIGRVLGAAALLILSARPGAATGAPPKSPVVMTEFHGQAYETCRVDPATQDLRLYWGDAQGSALGNFTALEKKVDSEGGKLLFAANAGMFDPASKPVGLLVENGEEKSPLNLSDGYGNFFLKPNGVFLINAKHRALVIESSTYVALVTPAVWATQSGPLLVYGGDINPDFIAGSKNLKNPQRRGRDGEGRDRVRIVETAGQFLRLRGFVPDQIRVPQRALSRRRNLRLPHTRHAGSRGRAPLRPDVWADQRSAARRRDSPACNSLN